jgi:hypothetical protein
MKPIVNQTLWQRLMTFSQCTRRSQLISLLVGLLSPIAVGAWANAQDTPYCQQLPGTIAQKEILRLAALKGDPTAKTQYAALIKQHRDRLTKCRSKTWPRNQGLWVRLYTCDARPGELDGVLDRIVNRGYNQVYVETFYNGQVLLPANRNPTVWTPVLLGSGSDNVDLLEQVIRKGRERGLKVYAWMFGLNFGASYVRRSDRQSTMARNGLGQTSLTANTIAGLSTEYGLFNPNEAFIDPYSSLARQDYTQLVEAIARYKPDGMLFDYIRYPRGQGAASVASKVQDLWIYGEGSQLTLLQRAQNYQGRELISRFLTRGYLRADDLQEVATRFPKEQQPLWQGRRAIQSPERIPIDQKVTLLQTELWQLTLAHAFQGVLDFVTQATQAVQARGMVAGAVFFPEGNQAVGQGFDSRMQPWHYFSPSLEWHPMSYATCGKVDCILSQVERVLRVAPEKVQVKPVLAGIWQQSVGNRPPLEVQMQALYRYASRISSVSHFAYSWQEPGSDRERKACR